MIIDAAQYKATTRQQWQNYATGWNDRAGLFDSWLVPAEPHGLKNAAALELDDQNAVWAEIGTPLVQYDTDDGLVGPCELAIAGATR